MDYYEYTITCGSGIKEILLALLGELPFESFEEMEAGWKAYLPANVDGPSVETGLLELQQRFPFQFSKTLIEAQNWNVEWESNFAPVLMEEFCGVRASFHEPLTGVEHEIIIDPKMAFGTGHHETTRLVISMMRSLAFGGKQVLDYGCGTGILAILAAQLGAQTIHALDIESEAFRNTVENCHRNRAGKVSAFLGDLSALPQATTYDIILANINRQVILASLPTLHRRLLPEGVLIISGFLIADGERMAHAFHSNGFSVRQVARDGNWLAAKLERQ